MNEWLLILGMMLVTFGVRYPVLAMIGRIHMPERLFRALRYVPVAVLTAIIVPEMVYRDGAIAIQITNAYLVAGILSVIVAWRTKSLLPTIAIGMGIFLLMRAIIAG